MTISSGGLIQATDYNTLRTTVVSILGTTGSGDVGYGQSVTADTDVVANTTLVSASPTTVKQWVALYNDMLKIAQHQGTDISAVTTAFTRASAPIATGSLIQYSDINTISTAVTTLYNNRLNIAATGYSALTTPLTSVRTTQWGSAATKPIIQHSFTVTFTNYNEARYFFNTGGAIQFSATRTGGSATTQNAAWDTLLSGMGTISFAYTDTTTTGTGSTSTIGFYDLSASPQTIFSKGGYGLSGRTDNLYTNNDYYITATITTAATTVITFNIYLTDDAKQQVSFPWGVFDYVDGTLTSTIGMKRAVVDSGVTATAPTFANTVNLSA